MKWLRKHGLAMRQAFAKLLAAPASSIASLCVLGLVCALPLAIWSVASGLIAAADKASEQTTLNIYLKMNASAADLNTLAKSLSAQADIKATTMIAREQALIDLAKRPELATLAASIDNNPLPHVIVVETRSRAAGERIAAELKTNAQVDRVFADFTWGDKLVSMGQLARRVALALTVATALALTLVVSNTVRLHVAGQRAEIEVSRLIGASASQVRRPFLYYGLLQGLLGGVLGFILAWGILTWLNAELQNQGGLWSVLGHLQRPDLMIFVIATLATALVGWLAAYRSVTAR